MGFTWTWDADAAGVWSDEDNWDLTGFGVPGTGGQASFSNLSVEDCTIDSDISLLVLDVDAAYDAHLDGGSANVTMEETGNCGVACAEFSPGSGIWRLASSTVGFGDVTLYHKGTGEFRFDGKSGQQYGAAATTTQPLIVDKPAGTLDFFTDWVADSLLAIHGTLDFYGKVGETVGSLRINSGVNIDGDGLGGSDLVVGGDCILKGSQSFTTSTAWTLAVSGRLRARRNVTLQRCDASGGSEGFAYGCTDGGNNTNWTFKKDQNRLVPIY